MKVFYFISKNDSPLCELITITHLIFAAITCEPHREKTGFCLGENKGADQLRGNREADQRLCFRYTDSTISLLLKSEISSF